VILPERLGGELVAQGLEVVPRSLDMPQMRRGMDLVKMSSYREMSGAYIVAEAFVEQAGATGVGLSNFYISGA
jgi:hypothetical protein